MNLLLEPHLISVRRSIAAGTDLRGTDQTFYKTP